MAIRPKTLPAAVAPVFIGTAMAAGDGVHHVPTALVALLGALTIQIGTNLANDYFDFKKGIDTEERVGPQRVMQAGLVSMQTMKCAIALTFSAAALVCIWLVLRAGWPIAVIGILAILSGIFYTAGPRPLGYLGLGEVFVLIFFGPVAVAGTYYVQSFEMNTAIILAGIAPGLLSSAILVVNNLRDIKTDRKAGKMTLAVRFGKAFAQTEYMVMILVASIMPVIIYGITRDHVWTLATVILPVLALPGIHAVYTKVDGPSLNKALSYTGILLVIFSIIFSIGWIL